MKKIIVLLASLSMSIKSMKLIKKSINYPKASLPMRTLKSPAPNHNSQKLERKAYSSARLNISSTKASNANQPIKAQSAINIKSYSTSNTPKNEKFPKKDAVFQQSKKWEKLILSTLSRLKGKYSMTVIEKSLPTETFDIKHYPDEYFIVWEKNFISESTMILKKFKIKITEHIEDEETRNNCLDYLSKMYMDLTKEILKNIHSTWNKIKEKRRAIATQQEPKKLSVQKVTQNFLEPPINNQNKSKESRISQWLSWLKNSFTWGSKIKTSVGENSAEQTVKADLDNNE